MRMASIPVQVIDAATTRALLPVAVCVDLMVDAMLAVTRRQVALSTRSAHALVDGSGHLGTMPGSCLEPRIFGCKVMSILPGNATQGRPTLNGVLLLFDAETGLPRAVIDGATLTAIRTAATSALATRLLARRDARTLLIMGNGVQAVEHIDAIRAVRDIGQVIVWSRSAERGLGLCRIQSERTGLPVVFEPNAERACAAADIICCTTAAATPVLRGRHVRPGTHVNLIGSHDAKSAEADAELIASSVVFVDHMESALRDAGEIVQAIGTGAITASQLRGEIGQLVEGTIAGRSSDAETTVFKSIGLLAQDLVAGAHADRVMRRSCGGAPDGR